MMADDAGRAAAIVAAHAADPYKYTHGRRWCACGRPWSGDPGAGGCEVRLLARRVIELEGRVRAMGEPVTPAQFEAFLAFVNGLAETRPAVQRVLFDVGADLGACRAEVAALRERADRQQARHVHELMTQEDAIIALQGDHATAAGRAELLAGLLREAVEGLSFCPLCGDGDPQHLPDCRYVAAMNDGEDD